MIAVSLVDYKHGTRLLESGLIGESTTEVMENYCREIGCDSVREDFMGRFGLVKGGICLVRFDLVLDGKCV